MYCFFSPFFTELHSIWNCKTSCWSYILNEGFSITWKISIFTIMVQNLHGCVSEDVHCIQTSAVNKSSILSEQNCALEKLKKKISYDRIGLIISFMQGGRINSEKTMWFPPPPPICSDNQGQRQKVYLYNWPIKRKLIIVLTN